MSALNKFMTLVHQGKALEVTQMLDEKAVAVDDQDSYKRAALHVAAEYGYAKLASALLDAKASLELPDSHGQTPLAVCAAASQDESTAVAALLFGRKAQVGAVDLLGRTALMRAAQKQHVELCKLLLDAKSTVQHQDALGRTALHSTGAGADVIALLLARSASVHARDKDGETPLMACAQSRHGSAAQVQLLLQAHADVHVQDKKLASTALRLAVRSCGGLSKISLLVAAGANVNAMSALHEQPIVASAISRRQEAVSELLLRSSADVHAIGASGKTVLQYALEAEAASTHHNTRIRALSSRITALVLKSMNAAGRAFVAQALAARAQHVDKHWTDHSLFDMNLVNEIAQYVTYGRNSGAPQLQQLHL
jgi:ankyrin repeat protein